MLRKMDNLDKQLVEQVFSLIKIQEISLFKDDLLSVGSLSEQVRKLFDELHEFVMSLCDVNLLDQRTELKNDEFQDEQLETNESIYSNSQFTVKRSHDKADRLENKRMKLIDESTKLEPYLTACDVLNDFFYDSLNRGIWCDVSTRERYAYGLVTLYFVLIKLFDLNDSEDGEQVLKLLNKIDYGLIYSPPFLNNLLAKVATRLHEHLLVKRPINQDYDLIDSNSQIKKDEMDLSQFTSHLDEAKAVKRVKLIDLSDFYENYFLKKEPVIIQNAIDNWPAVQNWNLNYIMNKTAYRLVPVEIGSRYTDQNWTQKVISMKEFIEKFIIEQNDFKGYLAQYELFERIEQLSEDFYIPDYCALSNVDEIKGRTNCKLEDEDVHVNAWFGPTNTRSPLHQDPKDNLLTQVFGSKYVRLYSPRIADANYYLHDSSLLHNTSQVDVESIDWNKYPNFPKDYQEAFLSKGDILYIPVKHWHYVRSLSTSFSISFWWK